MGGGQSFPDRKNNIKLEISQSLKRDDDVSVTGVIAADAKVFSMALVANNDKDGLPINVPFHYKVYLDEGRAATNIKHEGKWRKETEVEFPPLEKGGPFSINIRLTDEGFVIHVNNTYWTHGLRGSGHDVNSLEIWEGCHRIKSVTLHFSSE